MLEFDRALLDHVLRGEDRGLAADGEGEEVEDTEQVVEKFKDFLDNVTPEDFAQGEEGA